MLDHALGNGDAGGGGLQAGSGQIPSRQAAIKAGCPTTVHSLTINNVCASGMRAVTLDVPFGPKHGERVNLYPAPKAGAPVLVFIHGGYWQMRAKETFSFLAAGPLAHGIHVAFVGYTLAPEIRLEGIVAEVRSSISWLAGRATEFGGDPARIYVSGWSAGGHLTAMAMDEPAVKGGLAISGIYDLEPIRLCYLNQKLQMDLAEAGRMSPLLHLPPSSTPLVLAYGSDELPELQRQSETFAAARARAGLPGRLERLAGHNHFTILEELANPEGALTTLVRELVAV